MIRMNKKTKKMTIWLVIKKIVYLNKDKKVMLSVYKLDSQRFDYVLCIETSNGLLISIDVISEAINGQILDSQDSKFFCWITSKCYTNIVGDCLGFLLDKKEDSEQLRKILDKCNYETKNKLPYETVDEENRKILEKLHCEAFLVYVSDVSEPPIS